MTTQGIINWYDVTAKHASAIVEYGLAAANRYIDMLYTNKKATVYCTLLFLAIYEFEVLHIHRKSYFHISK